MGLLERSTAESDLEGDEKDAYTKTTVDMTMVLMDTARLRSGFELPDQQAFAARMERMLRLGVAEDAEVEAEPEYGDDEEEEEEDDEEEEEEEEEEDEEEEEGGDEEGGEEEGGEEEGGEEEPAAEEPVKDEL